MRWESDELFFVTGWWFGTFRLFFHTSGMSSSQVTNSIIFQRGRSTTNQVIIGWNSYEWGIRWINKHGESTPPKKGETNWWCLHPYGTMGILMSDLMRIEPTISISISISFSLSLSIYIYIIIYKCTLEISLEHNLAVPFFLDSMGISWDSRLCFFVYKTNWKDPPCYWWVNQLFQWAIFYVANCECHYQRVIGKPSPNYGSWYL